MDAITEYSKVGVRECVREIDEEMIPMHNIEFTRGDRWAPNRNLYYYESKRV